MATGSRNRRPSEADRPRNTPGLKRAGCLPRETMALTALDTAGVTAFHADPLSIFGRKVYLRLGYLFTAQRTEPRWYHHPTRLRTYIEAGIFQRKVGLEW